MDEFGENSRLDLFELVPLCCGCFKRHQKRKAHNMMGLKKTCRNFKNPLSTNLRVHFRILRHPTCHLGGILAAKGRRPPRPNFQAPPSHWLIDLGGRGRGRGCGEELGMGLLLRKTFRGALELVQRETKWKPTMLGGVCFQDLSNPEMRGTVLSFLSQFGSWQQQRKGPAGWPTL